jgi:2-polyprenyl-6-methoxyphenol hydroxylase-like FAD-dependent oxidoreductase
MSANGKSLGERAIVVGAGIAGALAARVLADHFREVIVLERDDPPDSSGYRKGLPQAKFVHGILRGGLDAMNSVFPELEQELYAEGAVRAKPVRDTLFVDSQGVWPRPDLGFELPLHSRPLLDRCLRTALARTPNVSLREKAAVQALFGDAEHVQGVSYRDGAGMITHLHADLIVDASGRPGHASQWLAPLGVAPPEQTRVDVDLSYASCFIRLARPPGLHSAVVAEPAPDGRYGCLVQAQEGDRMIVAISCRGRDAVIPEDFAAIVARAESLPHPATFEILRDAEPLTEVARFGFPASTHRHYERLAQVPAGFVCIGDALCCFNPVWGQGMSVAALEVSALARLLGDCAGGGGSLSALPGAFYQQAARTIATAWQLSVMPDYGFASTRGERPPTLKQGRGFMRALARLAQREPEVQLLVNEIYHFVKPLDLMRDPTLVSRVLPLMDSVAS